MSTNILTSSNSFHKVRQIPIFQIAHRKLNEQSSFQDHTNYKGTYQKHQSEQQKIIYAKINQVEDANRKLVDISKRLAHSSIMLNNQEKMQQVFYSIEQQMKTAFNNLIQSIQQFYIDIDSKIKQIGVYLANFSGTDTYETSKNCHEQLFSNINQQSRHQSKTSESQNLRTISHKIQNLQKDLQQTKINQKKLINIIQKLISKYQLNHETTIIQQDPFLKNKLSNIIEKLDKNDRRVYNNQRISTENSNGNLYNNTFAYSSNPNYVNSERPKIHRNINNLAQSSLQVSNVIQKKQKVPHKNVQSNNQNDYSLYHQLNRIDENPTKKQPNNQTNLSNHQFKGTMPQNYQQRSGYSYKNKKKPEEFSQKYGTSAVSITSYAVSNSMSNVEEEQCFIKKLYSKQSQSLNKVSLKGCNNYFQFKRIEQPVQKTNIGHRQAFLIKNLQK